MMIDEFVMSDEWNEALFETELFARTPPAFKNLFAWTPLGF